MYLCPLCCAQIRHMLVGTNCQRGKMRFYVPYVLCLTLLAASSAPMRAEESDEARIRSLEKKWADSYKHRKIDLLGSLLAEDFVITVEDGATYSKPGYITHSADPSVHVDVAEFTDLKVHLHGNAAVVTGAYHEKGRQDGKPYEYRDRLTDVWLRNSDGAWQVISSHYSVPMK
jgi:ketosteroid isomerase-like protein